MNNMEQIYSIIKQEKIAAYNTVMNRGLSVCFNFIEVPCENITGIATSIVTMSIMENRCRKNAMDSKSFARFMSLVESTFDSLSNYEEQPYLTSLWGKLPNKWYSYLGCHRIFLIPLPCVFEVIDLLFTKSKIAVMNELGIQEVSVVVNTKQHDLCMQAF